MPGRHWQLVTFTIVTQLAVGLMVMLAVGLQLTSGAHDPVELEELTTAMLEVMVVLLVLGVVAATTHLGSAGSAIKAFANHRGSWLSRESTAGGVFGLLTVAATVAYRLNLGSPAARRSCVVAAAVAGVVLVYAMARLYMLRTVPAWNTPATPVSFLTAAVLLGAAGSAAALLALGGSFAVADRLLSAMLPWIGWSCLVLAMVQLTVSRVAGWPVEAHPTHGALWSLSAVLGLGGAGLLLAAAHLAADSGAASSPPSSVSVAVASALLVASQVVGRFRFYASYDRTGV
jgi:anaerobic dimethyl sulfoxide reductase subunit C (anchor subunit)